MQNKLDSLVESISNSIFGFLISLILSPIIYYFCEVKVDFSQITLVSIFFLCVGILKGYLVRRFFNNFEKVKKFIKFLIKKWKS